MWAPSDFQVVTQQWLCAAADEPAERDAMDARKRAMAALLRAQQAQPATEPTDAAQEPSDVPQQHSAAPPHTSAHSDSHADGQAHSGVDAAAADAAAQEWAEDAEHADAAQFEAAAAEAGLDVIQDYDHLLEAKDQLWEASTAAESLPPGWAKCPNAGREVFGITPIKVRALSAARRLLGQRARSAQAGPSECTRNAAAQVVRVAAGSDRGGASAPHPRGVPVDT